MFMSKDEHVLYIDSTGDHSKDEYVVDGKRVDYATWIKYLRESKDKLMKLEANEETIRSLEFLRNELVTNVSTSGASAILESADPVKALTQWLKTELPNVLTQSQVDALTICEEKKKKKENTFSEKLKRNIWAIVLAIISVIAGAIASHAWP